MPSSNLIPTSSKGLSKLDSIDLATFIVAKLGPMTHLKLQKLVYYCEAYHLAYFDKPLIDDDFQAWVHGPVSVKLWVALKEKANIHDSLQVLPEKKGGAIKRVKDTVSIDQLKLIEDLLAEFGKKSAYELECLTHEEDPWVEARRGTPPDQKSKVLLSKVTMKKFYKKKLFAY